MTILNASRPARHRTAIVFAADGLYARFALLAAQTLRRQSPDAFDICLCGLGMPDAPPPDLVHLDIRRCAINPGTLFNGLRLDKGRTQVVYLRLAVPEAFADDYDRILYLDADILIEGGDFAALLAADMGGHAIAAVRDNTQWRTPGRRPEQFRRLNLPTAPYFNAGVMMIDVDRWNRSDVTGRAVAIGTKHREVMIRHDQNLLNAVLQGDWAELHPTWNWQYTYASNLFTGMFTPNLLHFISPSKPWKVDDGRYPLRFRQTYSDFLIRYFPDETQVAASKMRPEDAPHRLRKAAWKHFLSATRFARYLARFNDPYAPIPPR